MVFAKGFFFHGRSSVDGRFSFESGFFSVEGEFPVEEVFLFGSRSNSVGCGVP